MRGFLLLISTICLVPSMSFAGPVHDAAKKGDVAGIAAALDSGANVNELDGGATPLYWAARRGHLSAAKLLIERGAEVNATTKFGPALMAAVEKGKIELITLLLAKGADPNAQLGRLPGSSYRFRISPCGQGVDYGR